jgi:hypothetical protein
MIELINNLQREANREFTPVIARNLSTAYDWCANESGMLTRLLCLKCVLTSLAGSGCFARMKNHMATHVDIARSEMFKESCDEVRTRLVAMCKQVEQSMRLQADEIFMKMQRDYTEVVSGTQLPQGQMMPKQERQMRSDVSQTIEDFEETAAEAQKAAETAKLAAEQKQMALADAAAEQALSPGNAGSNEDQETSVRQSAKKIKSELAVEDGEGFSDLYVAGNNEDVDMN